MKIIATYDSKDYKSTDQLIERIACRAIILEYPYIFMIQSDKYKELKFPGGGQKPNESDYETLIRETLEETGLNIISSSIKEFGVVFEKRKSVVNQSDIFSMKSKYYTCRVELQIKQQNLDEYEKEYGYQLIKIHIDEAIKQNQSLLEKDITNIPWVTRELRVLHYIKDEF